MADKYKSADKHLKLDEKKPLGERSFTLVLLESEHSKFDAGDTTLEAALKRDENTEGERISLRTQLINDPTRPLGGSAKILQFFAVDPGRDALATATTPGVIVEQDGSKEVPLFFLTRAEVSRIAHGEGFATPLAE